MACYTQREGLLVSTSALNCWLFLADAQMENEYASLVRGDQGKEGLEDIPPILVPTKYESEEVRKAPLFVGDIRQPP